MTAADLAALGLPQVFSPAHAAEILRGLGLTEMSECALRARASRKQVPFHRNGRRITFTVSDLREIAEGAALRPQPPAETVTPATVPPPAPRRRSSPRNGATTPGPWRARRPRDLPAGAETPVRG